MIVPAVTEVCLPQPAHFQVDALVCSCQALFLPQAGIQSRAASAPRKGKRHRPPHPGSGSGTRPGSAENRAYVASRTNYVRFIFYHGRVAPLRIASPDAEG